MKDENDKEKRQDATRYYSINWRMDFTAKKSDILYNIVYQKTKDKLKKNHIKYQNIIIPFFLFLYLTII